MSALFTSLTSAISLINDGDVVAFEGFTHLIPFAAAHELIRHGRRNLTLVRMTPDLICDQLIGAGCAARLVFSWGGNPGVGSLHRFRDAVENSWPQPLAVEEYTHAALANAFPLQVFFNSTTGSFTQSPLGTGGAATPEPATFGLAGVALLWIHRFRK